MQPTDPGQPAPPPPPQQIPPQQGAPQPPPAQHVPYGQPAPEGYPPPGYGYPPAAAPRPTLPLNLGDGLIAFGSLLVFAFSFAPFVEYDNDDMISSLERSGLPTWFSAWSTETFMAPLTWFVVLAGLAAIGLVAARLAVPRDREFIGFRIGHLLVGIAVFNFVVLFGYAVSSKSAVFGHDLAVQYGSRDFAMALGWGGYLMVFGGLVAAVGAILSHLEIGPILYPPPPKPPATHYPGYGMPQQYQQPPAPPNAQWPTMPPPDATQPVPQVPQQDATQQVPQLPPQPPAPGAPQQQ